jgi:uncharacterized membrane protein
MYSAKWNLGHRLLWKPLMSFADVLLVIIRWLHAISAVAWVGGGIFYLVVLRPNLASEAGSGELARKLGEQFRYLVSTAIAVLVVTGVILTLDRLTSDHGGMPYVVVLSIKVVMALYMFYLVRFLRFRSYPANEPIGSTRLQKVTSFFTGATMVLVLGVLVFLLADILAELVEQEIRG